jgi:hypothetical protein
MEGLRKTIKNIVAGTPKYEATVLTVIVDRSSTSLPKAF